MKPSEQELEAWRLFDKLRKDKWIEFEGQTYDQDSWTRYFVKEIYPDDEKYKKVLELLTTIN